MVNESRQRFQVESIVNRGRQGYLRREEAEVLKNRFLALTTRSATLREMLPKLIVAASFFLCGARVLLAQSIATPWSGHGHDAQHSGVSKVQSQPLSTIRWQSPVDLDRQYSGSDLLIHYGSRGRLHDRGHTTREAEA